MPSNPLNVVRLLESIEYKEESVAAKTFLDKQGGTVVLYAFDKAQGLGEHTTPEVSWFFLIEGRADIVIDGKSDIISEGESVTVPANCPHSFLAVRKTKVLLTRINSQ